MRSIAIIVFFFSLFTEAQQPGVIQRTLVRLQNAKSDSERVELLGDLSFSYADIDPEKGVEYGRQALQLAGRTGSTTAQALAHGYIAFSLTRKSDFEQAEQEYAQSIAMYEALKDTCLAAGVMYNLGLNYQARQQQEKALEIFLKVLRMEERCPQKRVRSVRLYAIGTVYAYMDRYEKALPYYEEAIRLDSAARDTMRLAKELVAIGNVYAANKELNAALQAYDQAARYSAAVGDSLNLGYIHYNMADLYLMQGDTLRGVERAERSFVLLTRLGRLAESVHAGVHLADMLIRTRRSVKAEALLNKAIDLSDSLGLDGDHLLALRAMAQAKEAQGDARAALTWYKRFVAEQDSTNVREREQQLQEITARFETEKKQKELEAAQAREAVANATADRLRVQRGAYIIGAIVLAVLLVLFISRYRIKRRAAEELQRVNEEVVKQKERAEESERAKDRFLANVSHEIRTPLNAIMGFTGLLMHEHRDERSARYLSNIREAGDNLLVVINDVLDISRIEAGRLRLVEEPFDLHRSLRLCQGILQHRAEEQGDRLIIDLAPHVPTWVQGDGARLLQILLNLVGNALKFTAQGEVRVSVRMKGGNCSFEVRDTGIGIPEEKLATIFDRFSQVEVSDQRRYGGTGLGLAIVKELVALQQGTITVESEEGRGTVFTVELPLRAVSAPIGAAAIAVGPIERHLSGSTILVAEDNEMNALVTTETLRRYYPDCRTIVVSNGAQAVKEVEEDEDGDIALVLMDVQMPQMDGMEATRRIRSMTDHRSRLPIIALTASVLPSDLSRCVDAGMDACVSKPFKAEEMVEAIARLTGDRGVPPGVGYDVHDPRVALFHWLVPPRLKALTTALGAQQHDEVKRIVHALRPQLVEHDPLFAALCDRVIHGSTDGAGPWSMDTHELVSAIENSLR